jgi:predicted DsbA family dithiol-disulfide isomerase
LRYEFADDLQIRYVMSGMARELEDPAQLAVHSLDAAEESGMPVDPRVWLVDPPQSSHPVGIAVLAMAEQADPAPYLRRLREGLFCRRRKLDNADALLAEAKALPGIDLERFRIDLGSHALLERFGADLERARAVDPEHHAPGAGRVRLPSLEFSSEDGALRGVYGYSSYEELRDAATAVGAAPAQADSPQIEDALRRFGPMATAEVAAVCGLPGPRAPLELWRLASEWRVKAERVGGGELWSLP